MSMEGTAALTPKLDNPNGGAGRTGKSVYRNVFRAAFPENVHVGSQKARSLFRDSFLVQLDLSAADGVQANDEELVTALHPNTSLAEQYTLPVGVVDRVVTHARTQVVVPHGLAGPDNEGLAAALHVVHQAYALNNDRYFQVIAEAYSRSRGLTQGLLLDR
jgi:hypothetical protein